MVTGKMRHMDAREKYLSETFPVEDEHLQRIRSALIQDGKNGVQIAASDARVLQFALRLVRAQKVVEIGTLYGYSTLCMARALAPNGVIFSLDVSDAHHAKARALLSPAAEWPRYRQSNLP